VADLRTRGSLGLLREMLDEVDTFSGLLLFIDYKL
jgi:hypothetical protein